MAHIEAELARDRQQDLLAIAAAERDGQRVRMHGRIARQAERAERRQLRYRDQVKRLRADLEELERVR